MSKSETNKMRKNEGRTSDSEHFDPIIETDRQTDNHALTFIFKPYHPAKMSKSETNQTRKNENWTDSESNWGAIGGPFNPFQISVLVNLFQVKW